MPLGHGADDVEAESAAGHLALALGHGTEVLVEEVARVRHRETGTVISYGEAHRIAVTARHDLDGRAGGPMLDRVAEQIGEREDEPAPVAFQGEARLALAGDRRLAPPRPHGDVLDC